MCETRNNIHQDYQRDINYHVNLHWKSSIHTTHLEMRTFNLIFFKLEFYYFPADYVLPFFSCGIGLSITIVRSLQPPKLPLPSK
jgi:hypothetical protein